MNLVKNVLNTGKITRARLSFAYAFTIIVSIASYPLNSYAQTLTLDQSASDVTFQGSWLLQTNASAFNGSRFHDGNTGKGSKSAHYLPNIPVFGYYDVSIWNGYDAALAASYPVDLDTWNNLLHLTVTQPAVGTAFTWNLLGIQTFLPGRDGFVDILTTGTTGNVPADAVQFVLRAPEPVSLPGVNIVLPFPKKK